MPNEDLTLQQYNQAANLLEKKTEAFADKTFDIAQLPQILKERIKGRIDPKLRAAQRRREAEFYAAPAKYRSLFEDVENPLVRERLASEATAGILDQVNNIRDLRHARETSILEIITDVSNTAQAGLAKEEILLQTSTQKVNRLWDEYRESVRQRENAEQEARLRANSAQTQQSNRLAGIQGTLMQLIQIQAENAQNPDKDAFVDTNEFVKMRNEWAQQYGAQNLDEFDSYIDATKFNNIADSNNLSILNSSGLGETIEKSVSDDMITTKGRVDTIMQVLESQPDENIVFDQSEVLKELFETFPELRTLLNTAHKKELERYIEDVGVNFGKFDPIL